MEYLFPMSMPLNYYLMEQSAFSYTAVAYNLRDCERILPHTLVLIV